MCIRDSKYTILSMDTGGPTEARASAMTLKAGFHKKNGRGKGENERRDKVKVEFSQKLKKNEAAG